jgi:hypothetical protein
MCRLTRKGQGVAYEATWATKIQPWAERWLQAANDVHPTQLAYDEAMYPSYLSWSHWRCFPMAEDPEPHETEITDTFTTEPPAAFHVVVSYVSYITGCKG